MRGIVDAFSAIFLFYVFALDLENLKYSHCYRSQDLWFCRSFLIESGIFFFKFQMIDNYKIFSTFQKKRLETIHLQVPEDRHYFFQAIDPHSIPIWIAF